MPQGTDIPLATRSAGCAFAVLAGAARCGRGGLLPLTLCLLLLSCAHGPQIARSGAGVLVFLDLPEEALVRVDERVWSAELARQPGLTLPAGFRRVQVEVGGSLPWMAEIEILDGAIHELRLEMWPEFGSLDGPRNGGSPTSHLLRERGLAPVSDWRRHDSEIQPSEEAR